MAHVCLYIYTYTYTPLYKHNGPSWPGEMAQRYLLFQRTQVCFPTRTWRLKTICNFRSNALFWPSQELHPRGPQTYLQAKQSFTRNKTLQISSIIRFKCQVFRNSPLIWLVLLMIIVGMCLHFGA